MPNTLNRRESQALDLMANGQTIKEIAQSMGIAYHTAQTHQKNIFRKLGAVKMAHAVAIASGWPGVKPKHKQCQD